ncbi:Probable acetolactate synthase large subunit [Geodia barretti]|uniref:Probable acetolactate synthase large subunit n=1 Tax=Geodia barretti TaxID=519541 RepID=A0AA35WDR7_GEOBA|nr:Probable acetolactate synthase large subunit [Geodia barretti]
MPNMTGAQALIQSLVREGVEVVFGLPGVQIMEAYNAFYDQPGIRLITVRHEQSAGYMADGYARTTGRVGVALVVPGPGALNAAAAIGTAFAASSPVLLVSGQIDSNSLGQRKGALHEVNDQLDVFKPITKWNARTTKPEEIPRLVHMAVQHTLDGRPRPVEIEIPFDVLPASADMELLEREGTVKQAPDPAKVKQAAELLARAERPLIWAGGGCREADITTELADLAEALNAPVITTPEGKGAIAENHPLSLGTFYYGHGPAYYSLPQADVILAIGSRMNMNPRTPWSLHSGQTVIQIDADPEELGRNVEPQVGMVADAKQGVNELLAELGGSTKASQWNNGEMVEIRRQAAEDLRRLAPLQVEIIETMREELADDAIMVAGTTEVAYWGHLAFPVLKPRSYLTSSYFATLGYAFPTALGAKVGNPNRQVVATIGDGGFMYASSELSTAVQEGINVVTLVFNNGLLGASRADQMNRYQGRTIGTELHNPDFAQLAQVYGALGLKLDDRRELGPALHDALRANSAGGSVIIEMGGN